MALQWLFNLLLAFLWMALRGNWTLLDFLLGYLLGILLLALFRPFLPQPLYLRKWRAILRLLMLFGKELLLSNLEVMKQIIRSRITVQPGIVAVPLEVQKDWEITTLAHLITLTPGTLTLSVAEDRQKLYIHALHIENAEKLVSQIKGQFEQAILEVTRR